MSTIAGSKNTLLGYGAALPNAAASNQIVIGTQAETTHIAGGGVIISQSALTLSGNTALTVSGNAGAAGQYMVTGGAGQAPYWGPKAPQSLTGVSWTLANPLSNLYKIQGDGNVEHEWSLTLPSAASAAGSSIWLKNMATASGIIGASIVNEGAAGAVEALLMSPGDSGNVESDGTNWYVLSANQAFALPPPTPTVTGISPSTGNMSGNTAVSITGTNFTGATAVTIGGAAVTSFTVTNGGTEITAVTPSGTAGSASVLVTNAVGTNTANALYTYANVSPATFAYKGANQTWQVPAGVTQVTAIVAGSKGIIDSYNGAGATISGVVQLSTISGPLIIVCGGLPGYAGAPTAPDPFGGGGGYSAILTSAANCNSSGQPTYPPGNKPTGILIMAGGGGGGSGTYYNHGGNGGSWNGTNSTGGDGVGGATGGQTTNEQGDGQGGSGSGGSGGGLFTGGAGLADFRSSGGSGYYGGGGAGGGGNLSAGGGSSFVNTTLVTGVTNSVNNDWVGYVTLQWT